MATYAFQSWSVFVGGVDVTGTYIANGWLTNPNSPTTNLNLGEAVTLQANYALAPTYVLTLNQTVGGTISSAKTVYNEGETATITASVSSGYRLIDWLVDGVSQGVANLSISFPMNGDHTVQAVFELIPTYTLTLTQTVGGTISSSRLTYNAGETAIVSAVPLSGYVLTGWLRDSIAYDGVNSSISFVMDKSYVVQATFQESITQYNLALNQTVGGTISSPQTVYNAGTTATITATVSNGYKLTGWTVNGSAYNGTSLSIGVIMDSDKIVQAIFELIPNYTLTLNQTVNGTISSSKLTYVEGETAIITATPDANCQLTAWQRDNIAYNGTSLSISFVMNSNHTVQASFTLQNVTHTLILIQSDGGTITAPKTVYNEGETATITASALGGYSLTNWYVDGAIPTPPQDKANPLELPMDADHYVQANFDVGGTTGNLTIYLTDFPPNVAVNVYADISHTAQLTTNEVGYATTVFADLPVGPYGVTATWANGAKTVNIDLTSSGATVTITPEQPMDWTWLFFGLGGGLLLVGTVYMFKPSKKRRGR